ncbi:hypothetical protein Anas_01934 [Armadillidium nasatum]|uniref:Uncharacterized protein n=1 Tax=Armadillidium nasatum TaxID=96803 RepID=A0A5N5SKM1_9CRUS|nr:hypothetical protein Anas_01934 [Armadillidium nasatum]
MIFCENYSDLPTNKPKLFRNKLRRERNKLRKERQKERRKLFGNITGIGFDGRRDATLQISELNGKYYTSTILEDHYVITGEPGDFYLDHFSPESGKGIDIAHGIYKKVCGTELENRLSLVKADGTNVNTGHRNGSIRNLEMFLGKPLQHDICLLHLNELPLRHVFMKLDGTTKGNETLDSLSTDQYYAYRICCSIITGDLDDDLALLEVGPINHSRWLTLACKNSPLLCIFSETNWFHIKVKNKLTDGAGNLFHLIQRVNKFPDLKCKGDLLQNIKQQ